MPTEESLRKYADVALKIGLGIEVGDRLIISAPVELPDFVRLIVESAYEAGAVSVDVMWTDDQVSRARFSHGSEEAASVVGGMSQFRMSGFEAGASFLRVHAEDPAALAGVDAGRVQQFQKVNGEYLKPHFDAMGSLEVPWSIIAAPVPAWNNTVFETGDTEEQMWQAIFRACRVNQADPVAAWNEHLDDLVRRKEHLNSRGFARLRYEGPGTDLHLGMTDKGRWEGGRVHTPEGRPFAPNIPTEEVFTSPHRMKAEGTVRATKPLSYFGDLIDDFTFEMAQGKVVNASAGKGQEVLDRILGTDDGAVRFGEAAMVPQSGAVAAEGLVWNNTLYDENDACHIALGQSYSMCYEGADTLDEEGKLDAGLNRSTVHVDFVLGSPEVSVYGVIEDGSEEPIIKDGEWGFST